MAIKISVLSDHPNQEEALARELQKVCPSGVHAVSYQSEDQIGSIVLIDGLKDGSLVSDFVRSQVEKLDRRGKAIYLAVSDNLHSTPLLETGWVDDVLVYPFRRFELRSRLKTLQQILMWEEVHHLNSSVSQAIEGLKEDLKLAERLQKRRLPVRFQSKGLQIHSRYFAGMKSGGDFFDVAESQDAQSITMIMTDASSYGLSSAVLAVLTKMAVKLSASEKSSPYQTVVAIYRDLVATLSEKDSLSLFSGRLDKRRMDFSFSNFGTVGVFHLPKKKSWIELKPSHSALRLDMKDLAQLDENSETLVHLEPGDRLLVISDGFIEAFGGSDQTRQVLSSKDWADGKELLNELTFQMKKKLPTSTDDEDPMPDQDCSAIWIEVESGTIRLART